MISLEELTIGLKDKWLDYYELHQEWILNCACWVDGPSKGKRPNSKIILGFLGYVEPRLKNYLIPLLDLNNSGEDVIRVLELNFDPRIELENRSKQRQEKAQKTAKNLYKLQRLLYLFMTQNSVRSKQLIYLLGFNFIPHLNLKQCLETIANYELIAQELIELEQTQTVSILPESYIDSNTHYLNQIREKIQQEKSII